MIDSFGVTSMTAPLQRVAVRPPSPRSDFTAAHWSTPVDVEALLDQHAAFTGLLERLGCGVHVLPEKPELADSCFVYDPAFVVGQGVIQLGSSKTVRVAEAPVLTEELIHLGVPLVGALTGSATADGGDMFWLDDHTLAVGRSYRTNSVAVKQLTAMLQPHGVSIETFDLPHDQGPDYCLHLMSVVSPVRPDLAVVYEPLAPVALMQALGDRDMQVLALPSEDWLTLGCNVLAIAPGVVVIASGNDATAELLARHGCEVHVYASSELTKGEGGPTCLTRPLLRYSTFFGSKTASLAPILVD